jgi:hypothetical protein
MKHVLQARVPRLDPSAAGCGALEQLCQGVAAAKRLARDACPGIDQETLCGGAGAGTAARTQAAVEAALQLASEALSARLGRGAGSSGEEAGSGRVAVAAQLLRLAAEGPGQGAGRGPPGAAGAEAGAQAAALAALDCLGIEDLGERGRLAVAASGSEARAWGASARLPRLDRSQPRQQSSHDRASCDCRS